MNSLGRALFAAILLWLVAATPAHAAVSCTISAAPALNAIYASASNLDRQGTFTVTCSRNPAVDGRRHDIWIGIDQPNTGRTLPRDIGGSSLNYFIYRRNWGNGVWGNSGNFGINQNQYGGMQERIDFGTTGAATVIATYTFYIRFPSGQNRPAGVYVDTAIPVTLRYDSDAGAVLNSTTISIVASIQHHCRFSTDPTPVNRSYTAFSASTVGGVSNFEMTCTQGTTYTVALDAATGVVPNVQLRYTAVLSGGGATGTAVAQPYSVNVTFLAGQAGNCPNAASCTGTDTRTVTVTY